MVRTLTFRRSRLSIPESCRLGASHRIGAPQVENVRVPRVRPKVRHDELAPKAHEANPFADEHPDAVHRVQRDLRRQAIVEDPQPHVAFRRVATELREMRGIVLDTFG